MVALAGLRACGAMAAVSMVEAQQVVFVDDMYLCSSEI
jgi:hypothetical protein